MSAAADGRMSESKASKKKKWTPEETLEVLKLIIVFSKRVYNPGGSMKDGWSFLAAQVKFACPAIGEISYTNLKEKVERLLKQRVKDKANKDIMGRSLDEDGDDADPDELRTEHEKALDEIQVLQDAYEVSDFVCAVYYYV